METFIHFKTSAIKNKEVIETLISFKDKITVEDYIPYFVKCLIMNSNYDEIIKSIEYMSCLNVKLPEESVS